MIRLIDAMKQKFGTPANAMRALGIDPALLDGSPRGDAYRVELVDTPGLIYAVDGAIHRGEDKVNSHYTPDRGFTRARKFGSDQEEGEELLSEMLSEGDIADRIAQIIESAPEHQQEALSEALREMGEDRRGPRSWARDRLMRAKDARRYNRDRRRYGKDNPADFEGMPKTGTSGEDRRRMAGDSAYDSDPHAEFERLFGSGASSIERG